MKRVSRRPSKNRRSSPDRRRRPIPWTWVLAAILWTLPALVFSSSFGESFRLPKLVVTELLALVVILLLAAAVRHVESLDPSALIRHPAVQALIPLSLVSTLGLSTTHHPEVVRQGLTSLWIGAAACLTWSLALSAEARRRALEALAVPAVLLALIGVGQHHGLLHLFEFREMLQERIGLTSLAGGAFDLGAYLVLPALLAQLGLWSSLPGQTDAPGGGGNKKAPVRGNGFPWQRVAWALVLLLSFYAIALTRTLSALAALGLGSLVLWASLLPRRRMVRMVTSLVLLALVVGLAVTPLRQRLGNKVDELRTGNINRLLSGRLDGWRTAVWMVEQHPLLGVGHGAYRSVFGEAKLALREEGVSFYRRQHQPYFVNAHNDVLEHLAETGLLGGLALLWSLVWVGRSLARHRRAATELPPSHPRRRDVALMAGALAALGVLAMSNFPLRLALVAYPYLLLLAGVLALADEVETP